MKVNKRVALACVVFLLTWAAPASAQSDRGSITGTVTDPGGAVVAGARVTATNLDTGQVRETTTSDEGTFTIPELSADPYNVSVEAQGFKKSTVENVQVAVQVVRRVDVTLELGLISDVVTVTSDAVAPVIQTDSPVRQTNVTEREVRELPLLVSAESQGRTPLAFIFLDSNVTSTGTEGASDTRGTNASRFRVSGGQALGTEILIDGASTRRAQNGTFFSEVAPGPNAFQEFTVSTSSFSAEYGSTSGGVVNFTIKSGSNDFHGELYEFHRNRVLNANSFLNNAQGIRRPFDLQHNFGFNIGGPVTLPRFGEGGPSTINFRDRTFFFFNYEGYRFNRSESVAVSVPTELMRQGNFSELLTDPDVLRQFPGDASRGIAPGVRIYDPRSCNTPDCRTPFAGNIVPQSSFDPAGFAILQAFPRPNRAGVFRNFVTTTSVPTEMNNALFKIDQILSSSQRLAVSYSYRKADTMQGGFPRFPRPLVAFGVWDQSFKSHFARLQHDWSITPTLINHFNAGYTRYVVTNANTTLGFDPFSIGLPRTSVLGGAFPSVDIPGYGFPDNPNGDVRSYQGIGSTFFNDLPFADNTAQFSDFVTWVKGRHTLRFGGDVRIQQFNVAQLLSPGGWFNFRHDQTAATLPDPTPQDPLRRREDGGWPIASMITGATEFAFNSSKTIDPGWRYFYPAMFVQDDIKVTPRLTLNLGVRYEIPQPRTESQDRLRGFDPDVVNPAVGRRGALVAANGLGGLQAEHEGIAPKDYSAIGPRLGFAYSLNDRTVVRGGFGYYYSPILYGQGGVNFITEGTEGYNTHAVYPNFGQTSSFFLSSFPARPSVDPTNQFIGADVSYFDKDWRSGRTAQWSLDLQRELPYNFAASVGYIGHKGTRLKSNFNRLNAMPIPALALGHAILREPLRRITAPGNADDVAFSNAARAVATAAGVALPATNNAVFPGFDGTVAQALRPFPQYRNISNVLEHEGQSWYNALQLKLDRRFSQGIQFNASYTFSKLITDAAEDLLGGTPFGGIVQNFNDRRSLRSVSPNSAPHVLVFSYIIELPFGRGRRFLDQGGVVNTILGGWQVGGIHRYQSGLPLVISYNNGGAVEFLNYSGLNGNLRPNLTGQPIFTDEDPNGTSFRLVNRNAFAPPPAFNAGPALVVNGALNPDYRPYYQNPLRFFGTAPPVLDFARALPFRSENFSLLKKIDLRETWKLELRGEFFNLFNRHRYFGPDSNLDSPNFGISGVVNDPNAYAPRTVQVGARFIF
ncbi:MAG TPA: TonB-dependent receptor [Pyrinomonadaceae bacterium]|nr:TonB-dependent receptor [Pyrinomonadaceae bacterium]